MQIMIKTQTEFHDSHVRLEIEAERSEMEELSRRLFARPSERTAEVAERLNGELRRKAAQLNDLYGKLAEMAAELARTRNAHVCTERCRPNAHVAFEGRARVTKLEQDLKSATDTVAVRENQAILLKDQVAELETERDRLVAEVKRRFTTAQMADAQSAEIHRVTEPLLYQLSEARQLADIRAATIDELQSELADERKNRKLNREWAERTEVKLTKIADVVLRPETSQAVNDKLHHAATLARAITQVKEILGVTADRTSQA